MAKRGVGLNYFLRSDDVVLEVMMGKVAGHSDDGEGDGNIESLLLERHSPFFMRAQALHSYQWANPCYEASAYRGVVDAAYS